MTVAINRIDEFDIAKQETYGYLNDYQRAATKSAIYPGQGTALGLAYCALKLNGEAGELAEHVGKAMRDDGLVYEPHQRSAFGENLTSRMFAAIETTPERRVALVKEVGDVLWYLSAICNELGITLNDAAVTNLRKLADRQARGVQRGSGDNR